MMFNIASDKIELELSAQRASVLLGLLAIVVGTYLVVFSPVPNVREQRFVPLVAALDRIPKRFYYHPRWQRFYRSTWPLGIVVAASGVAWVSVGIYPHRLSRRPLWRAGR